MLPVKVLVSLTPVFLFLAALLFLDSYKLVRLRTVVQTIVVGIVVAVLFLFLNMELLTLSGMDRDIFARYVAPLLEELGKAVWIVYLLRSRKIGFLVDASILGFGIGAGFAFVENIYYLTQIDSSNLLLWIIRGFGTGVLHGSTVAIFAMISMGLFERRSSVSSVLLLPGFLAAVVLHVAFNLFILPPEISTAVLSVVFPLAVIIVFYRSEVATRNWLGTGLDTDMELLEIIMTDRLADSRIGKYLTSLKARIPAPILVDLLCLVRLHIELSMQAKGLLMMRQTGFEVKIDDESREKLAELRFLERNIGATGRLAVTPILNTSSRDLWQLYMLGK
jgi:RsiW-degrading membrane proteinase PrsW (M82 family)